jgi:hypothetical protein
LSIGWLGSNVAESKSGSTGAPAATLAISSAAQPRDMALKKLRQARSGHGEPSR